MAPFTRDLGVPGVNRNVSDRFKRRIGKNLDEADQKRYSFPWVHQPLCYEDIVNMNTGTQVLAQWTSV